MKPYINLTHNIHIRHREGRHLDNKTSHIFTYRYVQVPIRTGDYIEVDHSNPGIAVRTTLLVEKAEHVHQLVYGRALFKTVCGKGHALGSALSPDMRGTPEKLILYCLRIPVNFTLNN